MTTWDGGEDFTTRHLTISQTDIGYRLAGSGPAIVLIHGLASSSAAWRVVGPRLAARHTVLAVDLLGHGESAKPRGDYSLGAQASVIRDLMMALDIERATFVGHSFGGGIAMQVAYQFPERCHRMVLVSSGGLGREVTPLLRAVALPGAELVLPLVLSAKVQGALLAVGKGFRRLGLRFDDARCEMWDNYTSLTSAPGRAAFVSTVREVIDLGGQRISATEKLYLAASIPTLIVWGDRDSILPLAHAHAAHDAIPGSRLEILEGSGHFVPVQDGGRLAALVADFMATTEPAQANSLAFRDALRGAALRGGALRGAELRDAALRGAALRGAATAAGATQGSVGPGVAQEPAGAAT